MESYTSRPLRRKSATGMSAPASRQDRTDADDVARAQGISIGILALELGRLSLSSEGGDTA